MEWKIGETIAALRRQRGITQEALAGAVGGFAFNASTPRRIRQVINSFLLRNSFECAL